MVFEFLLLAGLCAPGVPSSTIGALISAESDFNPYAIGVVRGRISRQPVSLNEAIQTVDRLESAGFNYSVGLAQINKTNFKHHNLDARTMFDPCKNIEAGSKILKSCFRTSKSVDPANRLKAALSCYYSGTHNTDRYYRYINRVISRSRVDFAKIVIDARDRDENKLKPIKISHIGSAESKNASENQIPNRWNVPSNLVSRDSDLKSDTRIIVLGDSPRIGPTSE